MKTVKKITITIGTTIIVLLSIASIIFVSNLNINNTSEGNNIKEISKSSKDEILDFKDEVIEEKINAKEEEKIVKKYNLISSPIEIYQYEDQNQTMKDYYVKFINMSEHDNFNTSNFIFSYIEDDIVKQETIYFNGYKMHDTVIEYQDTNTHAIFGAYIEKIKKNDSTYYYKINAPKDTIINVIKPNKENNKNEDSKDFTKKVVAPF